MMNRSGKLHEDQP